MLIGCHHGKACERVNLVYTIHTESSGRQSSDQANRLGLEFAFGCYHLHPPSPFIVITQPEG